MSCCRDVTSLRHELFSQGDDVRRQDTLFILLCTNDDNILRKKLAQGVINMLSDISDHPAVADLISTVRSMSQSHTVVVEKTLILAAMVLEPNFLQHMMTLRGVCSSSLSEFSVRHLTDSLELFLKGDLVMEEFVQQLSHAYVSL